MLDWTLDREPGGRNTTLLVSDLLVRYGITDQLDVQLGWTAFGQVSTRTVGASERGSGSGDVLVALRRNVRNPDGSGLAIAVMPFATLPTGGTTIGAGDWAAGLLLPVSTELPGGFQLGFTGSVEAAVDEDRVGRRFAYASLQLDAGANVGLSRSTPDLQLYVGVARHF